MNNIIKILSLSLLLAGVNILSAADDKDAANHSTSMVSPGAFCEISDVQSHIDALKREEVKKLVKYTDNYNDPNKIEQLSEERFIPK